MYIIYGCYADPDPLLYTYNRFNWCGTRTHQLLIKTVLSDDSNSSDVNGKTVDGGYTPLHLAASAGHAEKYHKTDMHVTDALETAEL